MAPLSQRCVQLMSMSTQPPQHHGTSLTALCPVNVNVNTTTTTPWHFSHSTVCGEGPQISVDGSSSVNSQSERHISRG